MIVRRINNRLPVNLPRSEFDRLFENFMDNFPLVENFWTPGRRAFPAVNAWEDESTLYAEAEIPGLSMEDIEVSVLGDELTIKGERKDVATEGVTYHRRERGVGAFGRVLRLPAQVEADRVQATLRDGVLTITMPKAQAALPRKIKVQG